MIFWDTCLLFWYTNWWYTNRLPTPFKYTNLGLIGFLNEISSWIYQEEFLRETVRWSILPLVNYLIGKIFSRNLKELVSLRQNYAMQLTCYQHIPGHNKLSNLNDVSKIYSHTATWCSVLWHTALRGWYRFVKAVGARTPTTCVDSSKCGKATSGCWTLWLPEAINLLLLPSKSIHYPGNR